MRVNIHVDTSECNRLEVIDLVNYIFDEYGKKDDSSKMKLDGSNGDRKYFCNNISCKREITKDVVAFCLKPENKKRFDGKVYCLKCQGGF